MDRVSEVWHWVKIVSGIFMLVCLCLYMIRCFVKGDTVTLQEFETFFNGLEHYIFS